MSAVAPSCPISHSQQIPGARRQPAGVDISTIPVARDLRSVITAINAISNVVMHITRGAPQVNNIYPTNVNGIPSPVDQRPPSPRYGNISWQEESRTVQQQQVTNPDKETGGHVDIETISRVEWAEANTWNTLVYEGG